MISGWLSHYETTWLPVSSDVEASSLGPQRTGPEAPARPQGIAEALERDPDLARNLNTLVARLLSALSSHPQGREGCSDEHRIREIEWLVKIMVGKAAVLFRVEDL